MKKILILAAMAAFIGFAASCDKDDDLTPTNIERDWSKDIDLSNSYVKQLYEETGVAILTDYDDTLDVFYQGADYGVITNAEIEHIDTADRDKAVEWLKTNILDCFSTECIKNYFPRRLFLCRTLRVAGNTGFIGAWITELKYSNNLWGTSGTQHAYPFAQGMAIAVNVDELYNEETKIDYNTQYRTDIMTLICDELYMNNDWLDGITDSETVFPDDVTKMYGLNMYDTYALNTVDRTYHATVKGMYRTKYNADPTDSKKGDEISKVDWRRMTLNKFFEFGFPENGQNDNKAYGSFSFSWPKGTPTTYQSRYYSDYATTKTQVSYSCDGYVIISSNNQTTFINAHLASRIRNVQAPGGKYRDSRNLILALCDLNETKLTLYGDLLMQRLVGMSDYLKGYGIDFTKFNPAVGEMYKLVEQ